MGGGGGRTLEMLEGTQRGSTPFNNDLILQLIFSHLEDGDLLSARLVTKDWVLPATEEYRGRASNSPSIGGPEEGLRRRRMDDNVLILNDDSVSEFLQVMTPSTFIPIQQLSFRLDLLHVTPTALVDLLTFIAPWIRTLRVNPWTYWNVDVKSPLGDEEVKKGVEWVSALHNFPPLAFPCLQTLEVGGGKYRSRPLHQSLTLPMMMVLKNIIQGAGNLQEFKGRARFFGGSEEMVGAEREATKFITLALPPSLKVLGFNRNCAVDYEALTTLDLKLEELSGKGQPESDEAFIGFLDSQKGNLRRLRFRDLEDIYGPTFPQFPLLTHLKLDAKVSSTLECLQAFPTLETLHLDIRRDRDGGPTACISRLPTHPSVRTLIIRFNGNATMVNFPLLSHVIPNLRHVGFDWMNQSHLTQLFTHMPHIQSLSLGLGSLCMTPSLESVLSGIPPHLCTLTGKFDLEDASAFDAVALIASKTGEATKGLANLKDLRLLEISEYSDHSEYFLNKVTFQTVFMKLESLKEIRLHQQPNTACEPVMEALRRKGIHVRVFNTQE